MPGIKSSYQLASCRRRTARSPLRTHWVWTESLWFFQTPKSVWDWPYPLVMMLVACLTKVLAFRATKKNHNVCNELLFWSETLILVGRIGISLADSILFFKIHNYFCAHYNMFVCCTLQFQSKVALRNINSTIFEPLFWESGLLCNFKLFGANCVTMNSRFSCINSA